MRPHLHSPVLVALMRKYVRPNLEPPSMLVLHTPMQRCSLHTPRRTLQAIRFVVVDLTRPHASRTDSALPAYEVWGGAQLLYKNKISEDR